MEAILRSYKELLEKRMGIYSFVAMIVAAWEEYLKLSIWKEFWRHAKLTPSLEKK